MQPSHNSESEIQYLTREGQPKLAYIYTPPVAKGQHLPIVIFCGGFQSNMHGSKATYLEQQCIGKGQGYLRFDYSGHGMSDGEFKDGTISSWAQDALDVIDSLKLNDYILVGSSMGGWIAMLTAIARKGQAKGFVGIAAAPDFTDDIYHKRLSNEHRVTLHENGFVEIPSNYGDPYVITLDLIEDGRTKFLMEGQEKFDIPARLIQGKDDPDVVWTHALAIQKIMSHSDVEVTFIEDGDHSLSRPDDLDIIWQNIQQLC